MIVHKSILVCRKDARTGRSSMKIIIFTRYFLVFIGVFFGSTGVYAQTLCDAHNPTSSLQYDIGVTEYVRDISSKELTQMQGPHGFQNHEILGLAGGESGLRFEVTFLAQQYAEKKYCLRVKSIEAKFYAKPRIYIASNFKRGSCEYNKVLKHEAEHVKILKRAHREYVPKYRSHLYKISKTIPVLEPIDLIDVNSQKEELIRYIDSELASYMSVITQEVAKRQKEIDTPQEYKQVYSRCKRWEKKLAND